MVLAILFYFLSHFLIDWKSKSWPLTCVMHREYYFVNINRYNGFYGEKCKKCMIIIYFLFFGFKGIDTNLLQLYHYN